MKEHSEPSKEETPDQTLERVKKMNIPNAGETGMARKLHQTFVELETMRDFIEWLFDHDDMNHTTYPEKFDEFIKWQENGK